jgi:hypothetical protein
MTQRKQVMTYFFGVASFGGNGGLQFTVKSLAEQSGVTTKVARLVIADLRKLGLVQIVENPEIPKKREIVYTSRLFSADGFPDLCALVRTRYLLSNVIGMGKVWRDIDEVISMVGDNY